MTNNTEKPRTIVLTGGGTGGHITPILAVATELKRQDPTIRIVYIGERSGKFAHLTEGHSAIDAAYAVYAGKFRRYHGESWLRRLIDVKTNYQNMRDGIFVSLGFVQSLRLLKKLKPSVVFLKGGFVGVPVGLAAAKCHLPVVTHDSDALPGLANRLVSKWVTFHATGMPVDFYRYPSDKARHVGVLVGDAYQPVTSGVQASFKEELNIPEQAALVLVTGGSLGAQRLNTAMTQIAPELLEANPDLHIIHQVGKGNHEAYGAYTHNRLHVLEFMQGMHRYTGAADIVVTRAGANTLAELGVQGKACIVVPNPLLTGGHQLKNAQYLLQQEAVLIASETAKETDAAMLKDAINRLLHDPVQRQGLGAKLQSITIPDAAHKLAVVLLDIAKK
ncbi:MAG: UDP-N-acetylglucosamine--N-acetylmuramyl-(pentapeptide) pyrophosphoryl-undecaprenol [Candidatus Saccharibacteria bacterium]|nr:UDP-N-acetylglucosamine--N-acetylmuramyl-(pentapeptide) pyrophosphoryl-undecaprenol [Candidatus Saccharibacteria bacterium]